MPRIRFSNNMGDWPIERQAPGGSRRWGELEFVAPGEDGADEPDYWLVYEGLNEVEEARVAPGRVIYVTGEPEMKRHYDDRFLSQFGLVVTTQPRIRGANVIHVQPALPWHAGVVRRAGEGGQGARDVAALGYDDFRSIRPAKVKDISVVCTSKAHVEGQRRRLAFVRQLADRFGDRLDWFGRGVRPISDKWDAVAPYRFHVVLENTVEPHYWSEKLADAYLGLSFPIYWGCPNLGDYFAPEAFTPIDLDRPDEEIARIERLLEEGISPAREQALLAARTQVLDRYNLFPAVAALLERCEAGPARTVRVRPAVDFVPRRPLWRRAGSRALRALRA